MVTSVRKAPRSAARAAAEPAREAQYRWALADEPARLRCARRRASPLEAGLLRSARSVVRPVAGMRALPLGSVDPYRGGSFPAYVPECIEPGVANSAGPGHAIGS